MTRGAGPWRELEVAARAVRSRAYAPYSGYRVGAALRASSGRIFAACNVENASFGLCICAERSAVAAAVAAGEHAFTHLVVMSDGAPPASPCGMCRQTLAEFSTSLTIRITNVLGEGDEVSLRELLPLAFDGQKLKRTNSARKRRT
ncbi:MAG: cytidine deaminase [Deltaproteobacteria bacterium]|nr:cytidine deaminase [Deltaproteobacteria bacterium]